MEPSTAPEDHAFEPYATGGSAAEIPYSARPPEERALVDRDRNQPGWAQINTEYAAAALAEAELARAASAQQQLGVPELGELGVEP